MNFMENHFNEIMDIVPWKLFQWKNNLSEKGKMSGLEGPTIQSCMM